MNGKIIASKIALGSAQFGLTYGISNATGQITHSEGKAIIALGRSAGIHTIDTAIAYGDSEVTLGDLGVSEWQVITKLPEMPVSGNSVGDWVQVQLSGSLNRLRIESVHGLLLHRPAQLLGPDGKALYRALMAERKRGRVSKIGISIYGPEELELMPPSMRFDIVQAPFNILDTRMARSGWIERLQDAGCELHVRSIFLQGLLLMQRSARPAYFARWNALWADLESWLQDTGLSPLQACVRYALGVPGIDKVVMGIDSAAHLADIMSAAEGEIPQPPASLISDDTSLLNPALWKRP
ncbi:MAG: aldo/keto reductase [Gammaproteobacteria bacterium]|nr:aldo/keto reductase [Gammaproteobacteria bacterium]